MYKLCTVINELSAIAREQFELEQALLDGESKTTADHIQAKINDLQRKLVDITQSSNKQMNRVGVAENAVVCIIIVIYLY